VRRTAIVVGAGSYVVGDSFGPGVVLPTLLDLERAGRLDRILLVTRSPRPAGFWERVDAHRRDLESEAVVEEVVLDGDAGLGDLPFHEAAAFVSVPDPCHAEYARLFLERGTPTWLVKPMTGRGDESRELERSARERGVPLWVDYHKRFDASNLWLRRLIDSGELGRPLMMSVQYSQPRRLPLEDLAAWSGAVDVFQYIGCHYVDLGLFLFQGARPTRVSATGMPGRLAASGGPAHDLVHAALDLGFPDGRSLRMDFQVGWNDPDGTPAKSHQRVELTFEAGRVIADQKERGLERWSDDGFAQENPWFFQVLPDHSLGRNRVSGYGPESLRRFLAALDDERALASPDLPWAASALRTDEVLDAVRTSLERGGEWVGVVAARAA
jgi:predicted dehydrogenase